MNPRALILVLLLTSPLMSEEQFYYFTDGANCPHCVVLERNLKDKRVKDVKIKKNKVEISKQSRDILNGWNVTGVPTLFIADVTPDGIKVIKRHDGALSPEGLVLFLQRSE